jgi:hypothetical protein
LAEARQKAIAFVTHVPDATGFSEESSK